MLGSLVGQGEKLGPHRDITEPGSPRVFGELVMVKRCRIRALCAKQEAGSSPRTEGWHGASTGNSRDKNRLGLAEPCSQPH